jgi:hypothetical protein
MNILHPFPPRQPYGLNSYARNSAEPAATLSAGGRTEEHTKPADGNPVDPGNDVKISAAARLAAAEKADNAKDFDALSQEVREALDGQYAAQKASGSSTKIADMSSLSGRALAAIALNKTGSFSRSEVLTAKMTLKERERDEIVGTMGSGLNLGKMAAYGKQLVGEYDGMSSEERRARGWTETIRASAASMMQAGSTFPSMFDKI